MTCSGVPAKASLSAGRLIASAAFLLLLPLGALSAATPPTRASGDHAPGQDVCTANTTDALRQAARDITPEPPLQPHLVYAFSRLPVGGPAQIAVSGIKPAPVEPDDRFSMIRALLVIDPARETGPAALADGFAVSRSAASSVNPLVHDHRIEDGDLLLDFTVPSPWLRTGLGWHKARLVVIGCNDSGEVVFASAMDTTVSSWWTCVVVAGALTAALYVAGAYAACAADNRWRAADNRKTGWRYLDPVMMTSGPNGKGNISRLQILFFTGLLFFILLYLLLRIGLLSDMSDTVLLLLGISAVGAAASKATDVGQNRLSAENWSWLVSRGWLPEHGLASQSTARWSDLVTNTDDGFDVYHFQMLIFSLVVGVALLQTGFTDLAHFEVPSALLGVLGLSQAVYVGGKLVSAPACGDLDKALTELRKREAAWAAASSNSASGVAEPRQDGGAGSTSGALATARVAFEQQMELVRTYFPNVIGDVPKAADMSPHMFSSAPVQARA